MSSLLLIIGFRNLAALFFSSGAAEGSSYLDCVSTNSHHHDVKDIILVVIAGA